MFRGWLQLGQTEIANTSRCIQYMLAGVRNGTTTIEADDSWADLWRWLGREQQYDTPWTDDDCPWFDRSNPASTEFAGVWVLSADGVDAAPMERDVINAAKVGGGFGVTRTPPRKMKFEALVIGGTPAGLEYGLGWLSGVLRDDVCKGNEQPRKLMFLQSAPAHDPRATLEQVQRLGNAQARMFERVALTSQVEVKERLSPWVFERRQATMARVEFELTAAVPWAFSLPTRLVSGLQPYWGENDTVRFENVGEDGSCPSQCSVQPTMLVDPRAPRFVSVPRSVTPAVEAGCQPFESRRLTWVLEEGRLPAWGESMPTVVLRAGSQDERNVRIQWVEGKPRGEQDIACASVGEAMIAYVPARSRLTLDAVTGLATCITADGRELDASHLVTGRMGGPWRQPVLRCGREYSLLIDAERTVSSGFMVDVDSVVRAA